MRRVLTFTIAGFIAQLVDGSLGMGYGMTSTSLLVAASTTPAVASASVHLAEVGTTLVSGIAHHRFGNVDWRAVRWLAVPGAVGAFLGATALASVPAARAKPAMAVVLGLLGVYVIARFRFGRRLEETIARRPHRRRFYAGLGVGAGFLDAAGGGGWGPVSTPTLLAAGRMEPRRVIGTVSAAEFLVALGASAGFLLALSAADLNFALVAALLGGGLVAGPTAAYLVHYLEPRTLGVAAGGFVILMNLRTLLVAAGLAEGMANALGSLLGVVWLGGLAGLALRQRRARGELAAAA